MKSVEVVMDGGQSRGYAFVEFHTDKVCECMYVCLYTCMYVCMCVCVCTYVCVWPCVCIVCVGVESECLLVVSHCAQLSVR